jgi:hypothetical protein
MSDRKRKGSRFAKDGMRASVFQQVVLKEGYLEKLSSGFVKKWLIRYFELSGHYLKYYEKKETKSDATLKGVVDLKDVSEVNAEGAHIVVALNNGVTIKLKGSSEEVAELWAKEIEEVIGATSGSLLEYQTKTEAEEKVGNSGEKKAGEEAVCTRVMDCTCPDCVRDKSMVVELMKPENLEAEREEAAEKARKEAEEKAREEAEKKARKEAEEKARKEAEEKTRKEAEEKVREEAEEQARLEAAEMARKEAEEMTRKEAEEKARKGAEEKARKEADEQARKDLAVKLDHEERRSKQGTHDGKPTLITCMVVGCLNAIDETVCGSGYCTEHEHHPVGNASFEVVRQVLIDIRESTGYAGWAPGWDGMGWDVKKGWDKLETYTTMEQLEEEVYGINPIGPSWDYLGHLDRKLVRIELRCQHLTGTPPPSLGAQLPSPSQQTCAHDCSC